MGSPRASSHDRSPSLTQHRDSLPIILTPDDHGSVLMDGIPAPNADTMKELQVPTHPIPSMQGAFAESMLEASTTNSPTLPKPEALDAASRRRVLLDQDVSEETHAARWKQKPGQRYHELWKLMSQISFGIYLLLNGIAKDDEQVLNILQGHVDEVDAFLEMAIDDFDLAHRDIEERLKFLKMPLDNINIFDAMLEDRSFRLQIVTGNERIEHIITRTATAMNDTLKDVQQGLDATKEFAIYLAEEQDTASWRVERPEMQKVYEAMKGNAEGWYKAYVSLQTKGNHIGIALVQLGSIVAEMDRRAGEISRNTRFSIIPGPPASLSATSPINSPPSSPPFASQEISPSHHTKPSISSHQTNLSANSVTKDLPDDPKMITPAIQATLPVFQYVSERERTPEPESQSGLESEVESAGPIAEITLEPRTYTPVPQKPPTPEDDAPTPAVRHKTSLRQRFSLKRKDVPERKLVQTPVPTPMPTRSPPERPPTNLSQRPILESASSPGYSRAPDSAYCSDNDRVLAYSPSQEFARPKKETGSGYIASPRSDQQHFHPVRASPNSPLQRPWTAGPTNLRTYSASTTNLSTMSNMTTVTENGVKVKKKRSAFGWLKNAFALSEEEKADFERKRRGQNQNANAYAPNRKPQPRFLDGRRI